MSFKIRITGVPRDNTSPIWSIKDIEYPLHDLMKDTKFRSSVDASLYQDYVAVLNTEEALELHAKYSLVPLMVNGRYAESELLNHLRKGAPSTRWVIFEIYEVD